MYATRSTKWLWLLFQGIVFGTLSHHWSAAFDRCASSLAKEWGWPPPAPAPRPSSSLAWFCRTTASGADPRSGARRARPSPRDRCAGDRLGACWGVHGGRAARGGSGWKPFDRQRRAPFRKPQAAASAAQSQADGGRSRATRGQRLTLTLPSNQQGAGQGVKGAAGRIPRESPVHTAGARGDRRRRNRSGCRRHEGAFEPGRGARRGRDGGAEVVRG